MWQTYGGPSQKPVPMKGQGQTYISRRCLISPHEYHTLPLPFMMALKCVVLLPGAAVASNATILSSASGASTSAGKHDALSCNMSLPP